MEEEDLNLPVLTPNRIHLIQEFWLFGTRWVGCRINTGFQKFLAGILWELKTVRWGGDGGREGAIGAVWGRC